MMSEGVFLCDNINGSQCRWLSAAEQTKQDILLVFGRLLSLLLLLLCIIIIIIIITSLKDYSMLSELLRFQS
jgi:hypothetical protein